MKFQHDSYENEQNAGRAHFAMKWGYRAHNVLLMAIVIGLTCIPMVRHKYADDPLWSWVNVLVLVNVFVSLLGIWINGEAAQWHARATDDHYARAEKLKDRCRQCGALTDLGHELCTGCRMNEVSLHPAFAAAAKASREIAPRLWHELGCPALNLWPSVSDCTCKAKGAGA
jgi:hypothetical protein